MANRVTQHRSQRESDAKERASLKRENKALKKQLARLRRQLDKTHEVEETARFIIEEQQESMAVQEGATPGGGCEKCQSPNVVQIPTPNGILTVCKDCKHRKKDK